MVIEPLLAIGFTLLGAGIGALAVYLYLVRRMKQVNEKVLSNEVDFLTLLNEVKKE